MDDHLTPAEERDALAAELVLGLLEGQARADALRLSLSDPAFAAEVAAWEAKLAPLHGEWTDAEPGAAVWGAYRGGMMVGFALLARATLALCYVVPEALHQGVGRALLREAEAHARQSRLAALGLESTRTAEAFYRRNGYEAAGAVQSWAGLQAQPMRKVF